MLGWVTRCLPGFSLISLALLLLCAFTDILESPMLKGFLPTPSITPPTQNGPWSGLGLAQKAFIIYTVLLHVHTFGFTIRLAWSISRTLQSTKEVFQRRLATSPFPSPKPTRPEYQLYSDAPPSPVSLPDATISSFDKKDFITVHELTEKELIHAIILPNYCEDLHTLETTLKVLASHPRAKSQYEIYLAMEQKEAIAADKAGHLVSTFEHCFLDIHTTFHPAGIKGEIAGKSSNVACAARRIMEVHRTELKMDCCDVMVTVMDADTHLSRDYFTEILRLHYLHEDEADRSIYCCPILFDRNSHEVPALVRCADLMWGFAGLSTMYPGTWISIPTSVYSLPLSLAEKVGGWDSDPTAIGEDMHMLLKCYFETAGNIISRVVHSPASQCNVSSDSRHGWRRTVDTCAARYRQALRHMWGALDTGFAARRTLGYLRFHHRCSFLHPRHFALLSLLWEAHFLPAHLTIVMIFSVIYKFLTPATQIHPTLAWAFTVTEILRALSFIGMNGCLFLYEWWHKLHLDSRMEDMNEANIGDTGCARRLWYRPQFLIDRICFPIAGTVFGAVPTLHAVLSHFWTDRLVYRVSKKPTFSLEAVGLA
ncbi:hypothetical protein N7509_006324 [Penicillium cosmopolitanum]|uniref:Glycosyltransferase 2-like domain-containing protein n=1 Tax=Penicillium cosmopolitanum TaxID=1131564 RepID=A0A9W9W412_9EURO|nr:uncharacterized protein N7509_006324 [Penicillium cosmopolitanum]KAJ5398211.1 hypothetical protein N7509_006324 [Penicillium cosmopolitanum]